MESPAIVSESQKLCSSAFTAWCPAKSCRYHLPVNPANAPSASKKLIERPFGTKP